MTISVTMRFRARAGESLATVEKHSTPLEEATTPSLEALKAYSTASKVFLSSGAVRSLPMFKRTIAPPRGDPPRLVFDTDFIDTPGMSYDISADGQRLLVVK